MTDQQRACSVLPGDPYKAITPVLDEFRKDSVTFSRAFCPSPHCCPSRASFMTGLMPTQHGVWHNVNVTNAITRGLKEQVRPWSIDMMEAGYQMRLPTNGVLSLTVLIMMSSITWNPTRAR